ncbi:MAG: hypothetical protein A2687_01435 [Candidatus Levybacteria bacterium RIFCSPHIGHO2_01_FULL_38_26]|nr:MAG: hypothetical protein A2687_01435 [Candidatus Levybacteria bacterium RIFCSPHIGHO2_01_FULL_38_26]
MKKNLGIALFVLLVTIPVIVPFFHSGYFPTHDGEWAVVRLADMFRSLRDFQIPVRYSGALNFGYGYPLFNFAYPLPYYLGTLIHFLGIGFIDTIKILFAGSVALSALFMFLASRSLWKNSWAGVASSILYVYFPYRMVDLYVRGSIGESLSFALFPLLFYLAIKLIEKPSYFLVLGIAVSLAGLVMTHNIMTVLFLPVWIVFIASKIIFDKKKDAAKSIIISIFLGIGISAFFWIPAIFEKHLILLSQTPIADRSLYFVKLPQLLQGGGGYGVPTDPNGFGYQFGLPHLAILFIAIFILLLAISRSRELAKFARITVLLIVVILFYILLLFKPSAFLWENLPLLSEINYPWTALGILGFLTSLLAGFLCMQKYTRYIVFLLALAAVALVLPYAKPQYFVNRGDDFYLTNEATTTSSDELMPLWVKEKPTERFAEKVEIVEGVGAVSNVYYNSKEITFDVLTEENMTVRVNTIYYPGWNAIIYAPACHPELARLAAKRVSGSFLRFFGFQPQNDNECGGKELAIDYSNNKGVMDLQIPSGENKVELKFSETPLRIFADFITLTSFLVLLLLGFRVFLRRS